MVQIERTAAAANDLDAPIRARAEAFITDIEQFFEARLDGAYAVHKLPGALATQHEASLLLNHTLVPPLGIPPIDIVKLAGWI